MRTVILRLSGPSGDGQLHGLAEVVGSGGATPFKDDDDLLSLLHDANRTTSGAGQDTSDG
jgi:hypothetical protein